MSYTLTRQGLQEIVAGNTAAWVSALTVTSDDEALYPPKVFVFQAENPADPETRGWFTAIATPAQLLEYPEDTPVCESGELQQPYYRCSSMVIVGRHVSQIAALIEEIEDELRVLFADLVSIVNLEEESNLLIS